MIHDVVTFEDLKHATELVHESVERIRAIDNKQDLTELLVESLSMSLSIVADSNDDVDLKDSIAQTLHVTLMFSEIYKSTDDPKVIANYIADKHKAYMTNYLDLIQKNLLNKTNKGDNTYVN